jgi:hypothetical protein
MTLATVLHSTMTRSRKKLIMASIKAHALMAWAFANNRVEWEDGGWEITNPLIVGRNPNVTSYSYYEELPVAQTNEFITVRQTWSRVAGTVIISDQEEDENRGAAQIFKLVTAKMDILEESIKEKFGTYLYGLGTGNDPAGLQNIIPDDPTTGTYGGLDRAAEPQWRTSSYNFAGTLDETNIEEAFDDVLMDLTVKGEKPDLILLGVTCIVTIVQRSVTRLWLCSLTLVKVRAWLTWDSVVLVTRISHSSMMRIALSTRHTSSTPSIFVSISFDTLICVLRSLLLHGMWMQLVAVLCGRVSGLLGRTTVPTQL